jgi:hypothetical protein
LSDPGTRKRESTLLDWRRREEAVMVAIELDDHTFSLLCEADEKIRHTVLVIEQLRLHIAALHPTRRDLEARRLKGLLSNLDRLQQYRQALLTQPSLELMH